MSSLPYFALVNVSDASGAIRQRAPDEGQQHRRGDKAVEQARREPKAYQPYL